MVACSPKGGLTQPKQYNKKLEEHCDLEECVFPCLEGEEPFIDGTIGFVDVLLHMFNLLQLGTP